MVFFPALVTRSIFSLLQVSDSSASSATFIRWHVIVVWAIEAILDRGCSRDFTQSTQFCQWSFVGGVFSIWIGSPYLSHTFNPPRHTRKVLPSELTNSVPWSGLP